MINASTPSQLFRIGLACLLAGLVTAVAFPPAPHHQVHGMVRDEFGDPILSTKAVVLLEVGGTTIAQATIYQPDSNLGTNYRLIIPVDAGITSDKYKPTAVLPTVPFRLKVRIGNVVYLPLQMSGAAALLTKPGGTTRMDLTLGEDSDGDGIPDAWEKRLLLASGASGKSLADVKPGDDSDGDGMSNLQEYLAGTYAFDPKDGFTLAIKEVQFGRPVLEFTAVRGRTYSIHSSDDLITWRQTTFKLSTDSGLEAARERFVATDVRPVQAIADTSATLGSPVGDKSGPRFFKLMVE